MKPSNQTPSPVWFVAVVITLFVVGYVVIVVGIILSMNSRKAPGKEGKDDKTNWTVSGGSVFETSIKGHAYLIYYNGGGIVHAAHCPCFNKED